MRLLDTSTLTPESISRMSETDKLWIYNGLDCCLTHEIDSEIESVMDESAQKIYRLSRDLQAPILEMNMRGVRIDLAERDKAVASLRADVTKILTNFDRICLAVFNQTVNPNSPVKVKALFYEWLNLPPVKERNQQGVFAPSSSRTALEKLAGMYFSAKPFVAHILAARDILKQIGTLETELDERGRIYTSFSIGGTKTGRLASSMGDFSYGTNLQNMDPRVRRIFIADPGYKFCNIDLEQADARNVGAICWNLFPEFGDHNRFLDACQAADLHTAVSRMCWPELDWREGDNKHNRSIADQKFYREDSYRQASKKLGHATNFNGQAPELAKRIKIPEPVVREFQSRYFQTFPEVKRRIEWVGEQVVYNGFLITPFGRRRHFLKRRGDNRTVNEACAFDPQSMTADEVNHVLLNVFRLKRRYPDLHILLQVHDSLLLQYPEDLEDELVPEIRKAFAVPLTLRGQRQFVVPCEVQVGWNWDKKSEKNPDGLDVYRGTDPRQRVGK